MKRVLYTITFLFLVVFYSYSQERGQDVVYLKNGSIIRGIIIEQVPNKSKNFKPKAITFSFMG